MIRALLPLLLLTSSSLAADRKGCKDSPLLPRLAGAELEGCRARRYDEVHLPLSDEASRTQLVKGRVEWLRYSHPSRSAREIAREHQDALSGAGFTIAFAGRVGNALAVTARRPGAPESWASLQVEPYNLGERIITELIAVQVGEVEPRPGTSAPDRRDRKGCTDPSPLGRLAGSHIDTCEPKRHAELEFPSAGGTQTLEGTVAGARYRHDEQASPAEVLASYRRLLEAGGYSVLTEQSDGGERTLTANRSRDGKEEWLTIAAGTMNADEWTYSYVTSLTRHAL